MFVEAGETSSSPFQTQWNSLSIKKPMYQRRESTILVMGIKRQINTV